MRLAGLRHGIQASVVLELLPEIDHSFERADRHACSVSFAGIGIIAHQTRNISMFMSVHRVLDCHRLLCPMPVIRVQDEIARMQAGDELEAVCTDPGVMNDIPAWCRINGHEVIDVREQDDDYIVLIRVGEAD